MSPSKRFGPSHTSSSGRTGALGASIACPAGLGIEHASNADALQMTYPFSFLQVKIDGKDLLLSPKALLQTGLNIAQNLANLL